MTHSQTSDPMPDLGLYIHWPYCARICPYCDFNVYKAANGDPAGLLAAMIDDLENWRAITGPRTLHSIHFGGGTPSLMSPLEIAQILDRASAYYSFAPNIEIGLEANPSDLASYGDFESAGIERLSIGVQAFDDACLKRLGRDHTAAQSLKAIETAQVWFKRLSIDLIYARQNQSLANWQDELGQALAMGVDHLSAYQLTIEPGTAFAKQVERGALKPADEDLSADMYELTQQMTTEAGLAAYEVSNHARSMEHQSVHNRLYWQGADWIGIGPGAHSRLGSHSTGGRKAYAATRRPHDYIESVRHHNAHEIETLSAEDERTERILMGLRLVEEGLDLARLKTLTGLTPDITATQRFIDQGFLRLNNTRLSLTASGRIYADRIAGEIV